MLKLPATVRTVEVIDIRYRRATWPEGKTSICMVVLAHGDKLETRKAALIRQGYEIVEVYEPRKTQCID